MAQVSVTSTQTKPTSAATVGVPKPTADSLSTNDQPSSGYFSIIWTDNSYDLEPIFREDIEKWRCLLCGKVVKFAVQTICGHRFCGQCLTEYLPKDDTAAKCPARETDCQMISQENHTVSCTLAKYNRYTYIFGCDAQVYHFFKYWNEILYCFLLSVRFKSL